jgi:hypothetical protein
MFKVGQKVEVVKGTKDPDFGIDISGWSGIIFDLPEQNVLGIEFDEVTISKMSKKHIHSCDSRNLDHKLIYLSANEVQLCNHYDSEASEQSNEKPRKSNLFQKIFQKITVIFPHGKKV